MKKKIKDLTLEERGEICLKNRNCDACPLSAGYDCVKDIDIKKFIEVFQTEVEINE